MVDSYLSASQFSINETPHMFAPSSPMIPIFSSDLNNEMISHQESYVGRPLSGFNQGKEVKTFQANLPLDHIYSLVQKYFKTNITDASRIDSLIPSPVYSYSYNNKNSPRNEDGRFEKPSSYENYGTKIFINNSLNAIPVKEDRVSTYLYEEHISEENIQTSKKARKSHKSSESECSGVRQRQNKMKNFPGLILQNIKVKKFLERLLNSEDY